MTPPTAKPTTNAAPTKRKHDYLTRLWGTPESHPWTLRFICCGNEDGIESFRTWEEADAFREDYTGLGQSVDTASIAPHGFSAPIYEPGHRRAAILERRGA